jgi:hypothetical protein
MRGNRKPNPALREEAAPTAKELARRLRAKVPQTAGPFPSAGEMLREDRLR